MEVKAAFLEDGGSQFHYIECLNDSPAWIEGLQSLAMQHMGGWRLEGVSAKHREDSRTAALAMGAKD
jgi:ferrochelatase